ncbi:uncharacterized protein EV420DRAFT_1569127 [Desarmillaria tabescens]|uniref:Heterokaryon incompatibility domain-containing protein n=1 Tax=Armillaria tabescens TaxID=1929756 RepID=A0AA39JS56_ARMTA|nr:uncharacterized protein EV420DRAFT_1569127 [Desarmillaria tabescens]KAK0446955.1 hypothetical protein EV420DRAFT_1569127 [Desarmillaria tabescens]
MLQNWRWNRLYADVRSPSSSVEQSHLKHESLPEVVLSALTEIGQEESSVPVSKQRSYAGKKPVIASSLANTPCAELGVDGLLEKLNTIFGTPYVLDIPSTASYLLERLLFFLGIVHTTSLYSLLKGYIAEDFGTAYAHLRPVRHTDLTITAHKLRTRKARDRKMRHAVLVNNTLVDSLVPPRCVWDLYSNRVVPWWAVSQKPWAISHAWIEESDRTDVTTPINGCKRPVPIPKDTNLDCIRIEMLNLGAEYVWLDVLCLRQRGGRREDLRAKEWRVDVPTIGGIYRQTKIVCYFGSLGRPFKDLKADDFERTIEEDIQRRLHEQLTLLRKLQDARNVFHVLLQMQSRVSTNRVDKVAGLAHLLRSISIPAYYEKRSEEDAWTALVNVMWKCLREQLLFGYPGPGDGNRIWRPSWKQVMTEKLPLQSMGPHNIVTGWEVDPDIDLCRGYYVESALVQGLAEEDSRGQSRRGKLIVRDKDGMDHVFEIVANHQYPITEGSYTVVGNIGEWSTEKKMKFWLVGRRRSGYKRRFEKVSIFILPDNEDRKRLENLDVVKWSTVLLA